jgi:hypothetical protein
MNKENCCVEGCEHTKYSEEYLKGYNAAIKLAANICEQMVIVGRSWTEEQAICADALFAASANIKKLVP